MKTRDAVISAADVLEFRTGKSWTQDEAAEWAVVSVRTWQRWESGDSAVPAFHARQIASRLARFRGAR